MDPLSAAILPCAVALSSYQKEYATKAKPTWSFAINGVMSAKNDFTQCRSPEFNQGATPCSVKAQGGVRRPPRLFALADCKIRDSIPSALN